MVHPVNQFDQNQPAPLPEFDDDGDVIMYDIPQDGEPLMGGVRPHDDGHGARLAQLRPQIRRRMEHVARARRAARAAMAARRVLGRDRI